MSDAPKKLPLFQIHLSTAIVLMFVAGGLIWANVQSRDGCGYYTVNFADGPPRYFEQIRGWPFDAAVGRWEPKSLKPEWSTTWSCRAATADLAFAVAILFAATLFCEWLLRRRERRHE